MAGVGQRMITGVAKRMAGQFFKAIDDELTGAVVPIAAAPSAAAAAASRRWPAVRRRGAAGLRGPGARRGPLGGDVQTLRSAPSAAPLLTLIGVLVGYRLGRRKG